MREQKINASQFKVVFDQDGPPADIDRLIEILLDLAIEDVRHGRDIEFQKAAKEKRKRPTRLGESPTSEKMPAVAKEPSKKAPEQKASKRTSAGGT